ncbi:MAG: hypothetical protein M3H12_04045 [Chromatiales bacterium]|nr:glutamyl-tRNA amidotransferase [Gammaproteobacteria bacterium]
MKQITLLSILLFGLFGCQEIDVSQMSPEERDAVTSLTWLKNADAATDADTAIKRGDHRLIAMATRNPTLPGVPVESSSKAKSVCGIRYLEGSTDAVVSDLHLQLLQAAQEYAEQYNHIMLKRCLSRSK